MLDTPAILAALIYARRDGDERAVSEALTRLSERDIRVFFGDSLPPRPSRIPVAYAT